MSYTTVAEVRLAASPLLSGVNDSPASTTGTAADLSDEQLQDAINEAESVIDTYIGSRYATPVAPVGNAEEVPRPIPYWGRTVALYFATLTYRGSQDLDDNDPVIRRYNAVMLALTDVRDGKVSLDLPRDGGDGGTGGAGQVQNPYSGTMFAMDDFGLGLGVGNGNCGPGKWWGR